MALLCKRCFADVTDDMPRAKPKTLFRCKCGSAIFIYQADDPTVAYVLTANDEKLLRRFLILYEPTTR